MSFQFQLAPVLKVRESIEKQEERALERIQLEIALASRQIESAQEAMANARRDWQQALRNATPATHLQSMLEHEQSFDVARQASIEKLARLKAQRDQQLKRYHVAHRDHESLLNIRNERLAEHKQQQARSEQKTLDDIFAARRPPR
jgi:flagellar export protein FliJ